MGEKGEKMPTINFTVFIEKVKSGEKTQTIRPPRKRPIKAGDKLYLYAGLRTKNARKLGEGICTETFPIYLWWVHDLDYGIFLDDESISMSQYIRLGREIAKRDGFSNRRKMLLWFHKRYGLLDSKRFDVIRWKKVRG